MTDPSCTFDPDWSIVPIDGSFTPREGEAIIVRLPPEETGTGYPALEVGTYTSDPEYEGYFDSLLKRHPQRREWRFDFWWIPIVDLAQHFEHEIRVRREREEEEKARAQAELRQWVHTPLGPK